MRPSPSLFSPASLLFRAWREGKREKGKRAASYRRWKRAEERAEDRDQEAARERDHAADCFSQTKTAELRTRREGQGRDVSRGLGEQKRFIVPTPRYHPRRVLPPVQIFISRTKTCAALPFSSSSSSFVIGQFENLRLICAIAV